MIRLFLFAALIAQFACQQKAPQQPAEVPALQSQTLQDFPQVIQQGSQLYFKVFNTGFSMETPNALKPYTHQDIPWLDPQRFDEQSGTFITWLRNQDPVSLQSPNIRLSYILKSPGQENIEVLSQWLDQQTLNLPGARRLKADSYQQNQQGLNTFTKALYRPNFQNKVAKYIAYAYWDIDPAYIIGLNLTALDSTTYESLLDDFDLLINSMQIPPAKEDGEKLLEAEKN